MLDDPKVVTQYNKELPGSPYMPNKIMPQTAWAKSDPTDFRPPPPAAVLLCR